MSSAWLVSSLLVGCGPDGRGPAEGVAVGNPTNNAQLSARLAPVERWEVEVATQRADWTAVTCFGDEVPLERGQDDLLGGAGVDYTGPVWCAVRWRPQGVLRVAGEVDGDPVDLSLQLGGMVLTAAAPADEGAFVLEVGAPRWLEPDGELTLKPGDVLSKDLADQLLSTSRLIWDRDEDGEVSSPERDQALAIAVPEPDSGDDTN